LHSFHFKIALLQITSPIEGEVKGEEIIFWATLTPTLSRQRERGAMDIRRQILNCTRNGLL
jgi:hypothetical protein